MVRKTAKKRSGYGKMVSWGCGGWYEQLPRITPTPGYVKSYGIDTPGAYQMFYPNVTNYQLVQTPILGPTGVGLLENNSRAAGFGVGGYIMQQLDHMEKVLQNEKRILAGWIKVARKNPNDRVAQFSVKFHGDNVRKMQDAISNVMYDKIPQSRSGYGRKTQLRKTRVARRKPVRKYKARRPIKRVGRKSRFGYNTQINARYLEATQSVGSAKRTAIGNPSEGIFYDTDLSPSRIRLPTPLGQWAIPKFK